MAWQRLCCAPLGGHRQSACTLEVQRDCLGLCCFKKTKAWDGTKQSCPRAALRALVAIDLAGESSCQTHGRSRDLKVLLPSQNRLESAKAPSRGSCLVGCEVVSFICVEIALAEPAVWMPFLPAPAGSGAPGVQQQACGCRQQHRHAGPQGVLATWIGEQGRSLEVCWGMALAKSASPLQSQLSGATMPSSHPCL